MSDLGPLEPVALLMELPMLTFHVTVTIFIAAKVRKRSTLFSGAFYKLYLAQCVTNYMAYATVLIDRNHWFPGILLPVWTPVTLWGFNSFYQLSAYLQLAAFTMIALNRWTALVFPLHHREMWHGLRVRVLAFAMIVLSLIVSLVRPVAALVYMTTQGLRPNEAFGLAGSSRAWTIASYNLVITLVDAALEVWSFVAYRALSFHGKRENLENLRLLVFSMLEMIPQLLKVTFYVCNALHLIPYPGALDTSFTFLLTFQALIGPICLFAISDSLRTEYRSFYSMRRSLTSVEALTVRPVQANP